MMKGVVSATRPLKLAVLIAISRGMIVHLVSKRQSSREEKGERGYLIVGLHVFTHSHMHIYTHTRTHSLGSVFPCVPHALHHEGM